MNIKKPATTCLLLSVAASALAQDDRFAGVTIETVPVTGNISMLIGSGGNADFGVASIIIAHENVRGRLVAGDLPGSALPVITFDDDVTVRFNGENITLIHMPRGHTDSR